MNFRSAYFITTAVLAVTFSTVPAGSFDPIDALDGRIIGLAPITAVVTSKMAYEPTIVPLDYLETLLPDVDRREYLTHLVRTVTDGAKGAEAISVRWVTWLQYHFAHPIIPPLDDQGTAIYDPLWLLMSRVAHCGQVNRLIVDGLDTMGIPARVIQLSGHVAAEAYFDGAWHYLDADILGLGEVVRTPEGHIPSTAEIASDLSLLLSVRPYQESVYYPRGTTMTTDVRMATFAAVFKPAIVDGIGTTPLVIEKTATRGEEKGVYYGWNYYKWVDYSALPNDVSSGR